ncbi:hypothetical protein SY83_07785 [Paenibacillus swuensis]|uniref:DUF1836 domain-containing protein n=1 Tax=Paenibacillus swuensis TaxID=1178515 RepID=A0A172TGK6_9BACL|nr:DUF1836 domain-containing protein [Paenibacillus swuensis]ANE46188.1 hypothetical protein SY83_07785 [Paenibacillus swuensis]
METLTFTRKEMSRLLSTLGQDSKISPLSVIQEIWRSRHLQDMAQGNSMSAFISTSLPPVIEKMIKSQTAPAFSLHEIVALGAQIEYTQFSVTSVQNWVKRDFKSFIGPPEAGKKYSLQQVSLFFIIEDLRSTLHYDEIRKLFQFLFQPMSEQEKTCVSPLNFYNAYADLFEKLDDRYRNYKGSQTDLVYKWDRMLSELAEEYVASLPERDVNSNEILQNALHVALISVHTSCFQVLSRRYVNGMMFLHNLDK